MLIPKDKDLTQELLSMVTSRLVVAWDLDGTLIDASHRTKQTEEGNFDLQYWIDHSTVEFIMQDKLLPLVAVFYEFQKTGFPQICVTARDMTKADELFLKKYNLNFNLILHREDSKDLDYILKSKKVQSFLKEKDLLPFMAFDDVESNLKIFDSYGFRTFHAGYLNAKLRLGRYSELQGILPKFFV